MRWIKKYRVPVAVAAVLAVLALVFHVRLIAWFTGERTGDGAFSASATTTAGGWQIAASIEPDPPQQKGNRVRFEVKDAAGKPVEGADVAVTYDMPAMGSMPEMKSTFSAKRTTAGVYVGEFDLPMAGSWTLIAAIKTAANSATARYTLTVGTKGLTALGAEGGGIAAGSAAAASGETCQIAASVEPDPPQQNGNRLRVDVNDPSGKPVEGADVSVTYVMPAMGSMQEMTGTFVAKPAGPGRYAGTFDLPMAGSWTLIVTVKSIAGSATARYALTVGSKGLTPIGEDAQGSPFADAGSGEIAYYTCSMHPSVHAHEPGKCPVCSMDLQAITKADEQTGVVQLDEARQKAIGVRAEKVTKAPMTLDVRAVGKLTYDETRLTDVVLKVNGYVSGLRVTAMGQAVKKGETLFQIYSPELFSAEQDYLLARSSREALGGAGHGDELVRAAETRLGLLGLMDGQIQAIAKTGKVIEKLAFTSPASGTVIEKNVVEGAAIKAGDRVFRIAPLDKVWVEADVFEADLARITKGQSATISLSYIPDRTFDGKVTFVYPYLDPNARTGRVRIELPNAALELKPDMYANVTFHIALGDRLQIPTTAIIYTGPRKIVIVDLGSGRLAPREVKIGAQSGDRAEVLSGLNEGDAVVTSGNFLIAAESRIRSSGTFWRDAP